MPLYDADDHVRLWPDPWWRPALWFTLGIRNSSVVVHIFTEVFLGILYNCGNTEKSNPMEIDMLPPAVKGRMVFGHPSARVDVLRAIS